MRVMLSLALRLLVPLARRWVDAHEARILRQGVALTLPQIEDARRAGVVAPERVRLQCVVRIPTPVDPLLRRANALVRAVTGDTIGITFGHGIYLRADAWGDRALVVHELVHVAQYERFGSTSRFLERYLEECLRDGYPHGPLEREAITRTAEICR